LLPVDDDAVFRALADPTRRLLLDRLRQRDGRTLTELESELPMTRFGVMKHLRVLEEAGLVVARKVGREKHHYLNPVPIQRVADRWVGRFREAAGLLADLTYLLSPGGAPTPPSSGAWGANPMPGRPALEGTMTMTDETTQAPPAHVFRTYIRTTPEALWRALTESEFTTRYYFASTIESTWEKGAPYAMHIDGRLAVDGEVLEVDPPRRLVQTFRPHWKEGMAGDRQSRVTWEIEQQGNVCLLTVVHDQWTTTEGMYEQAAGGWPLILSGLKTLLETGEPLAG
jgi:uncharacterized protein YndB with AHSA1/START domain/DNA-binding transcriptional ArsR family regulator